MPAGVDLKARDSNGDLVLQVDPTQNESPNPLYQMLNREYNQNRSRFLGAANLQWSPIDWLRIDGNMSYDRSDRRNEDLYPKGYRTIQPNASLNDGSLNLSTGTSEALNASITASMNFNLTDNITNQTQLRYLYEQQDNYSVNTGGNTFAVANVPVLGNLDQTTVGSSSSITQVLADGYFAITNFEISDRYILDALVRNDGSSLFGEDQRRQWYYRVAGAWRMAEEPWFPIDAVDELKLRYSLGTAGGRPRFSAQYETYSVGGGRVSPVNLGNKDLKPEYSVEQEVGLDAVMFQGRFLIGATYAVSETSDQILPVPLPAYSGFGTQWRNVGTLSNNTIELSLQANLVQKRDLNWSARLIYDNTNSEITELTAPPFTYGVGGQGLGSVFYAREGEQFGTFYGVRYAQSCDDLPTDMSCDGFTVDQNGWLVYTGDASFSAPNWGGSSQDDGVLVRGAGVPWGTPFSGECTDRSTGERTLFCPVGNSIPDYNIGLSTTLTWGGLSLYGLLDSSQNFDVYNQPLQWGLFKRFAGIMDQRGVPDVDAKPLGYWDALYGVSGLQPSNAFVEDASFIKLRELSASYRFDAEMLSGIPGLQRFSSISLNLTGRNLFTFTDYRGYDPEVGKDGGNTGSAAIARVEGYQYPNFRTWTAGLELVF
ncbi:MAG: TonB-dependent receptor, partial [Gemmatimonadota bacterium]